MTTRTTITVEGHQSAAMTIATIVLTILLAPAAWALVHANLLVGLIASLGIALALRLCWSNLLEVWRLRSPKHLPASPAQRLVLLGAFPVTLLGSVSECAGFRGCTSICSFLNTSVVPALIILAAIYLIVPRRTILFGLTAGCFVLLVPSCRCYNPLNGAWIDLLGLSPVCFLGSFTIGIMVIGCLTTRLWVGTAAAIAWPTALAQFALGFSHHHFHWPW